MRPRLFIFSIVFILTAIFSLGASATGAIDASAFGSSRDHPAKDHRNYNQSELGGTVHLIDGSPVNGVIVDYFVANDDGLRGRWLGDERTDKNGSFGRAIKPVCYVLVFNAPDGTEFVGGNRYLERSACVAAAREPGDKITLTYSELLAGVCKFANVLKAQGLNRGDRVAIYMPMILELPTAMLACARIGVAHSVIFGGFSADAIVDRCDDAQCRIIITADGGYRKGSAAPLKATVDAAMEIGAPSVEKVIVANRCDPNPPMVEGRDLWWHDLMVDASDQCPAEPMDAEQLLYILYTSGTTAKPKGIMHTTGGYLTQVAFTHKYVFDIKPETDIYWCAADIGWVTGHSYIVYGPLANGVTSVMYEGTPDTPGQDRLWDIAERYGVTQLYTAPTAIRMFMKWGAQEPAKHDLSSLRVLGTVGEPVNPEAWMWYHEHIGGEARPIVDTWWQTETGGNMITPLPGVTTTKPGSACHPIPGVFAELVDDGNVVTDGGGYLTITHPWPSMLRGIWGDDQRYRDTYWSTYEGSLLRRRWRKAGRRRLSVVPWPGR